MIAGKKYVGLEVDIWSCGVVLYALVCGYLPFEDSNTSVLYKKIMAGDYTIPKFLSPEAKDLIKNILTTDPNKRYKIDDIRKHPWYQLYKPRKEPEGIFVSDFYCPVNEKREFSA
jgi:5'-AMP-activated protein kinase catalytic alpha subunit